MDNNIILPPFIDGKPLAYDFGTENIAVVRGQEPDFSKVSIGAEARIVPEPDNPYDNRAIAVYSNAAKLGYLYKGKAQDVAHDFIRKNDPFYARIFQIDSVNKKIQIILGFYCLKASNKNEDAEFKTFRLTSNKSEEMQDNISLASEGDEVSYDYDFEKEKYLASSDVGDIGYFSKSAEKYLEEGCSIIIHEINDNEETDKYDITVAIYSR
jgi:hypothetical protein